MRICDVCGKGPLNGNSISHSHKINKRKWYPNLQKATIMLDGSKKKANVCTKCLKTVERA